MKNNVPPNASLIRIHSKALLQIIRPYIKEFTKDEISRTEKRLDSLLLPYTNVVERVESVVDEFSKAERSAVGNLLKYQYLLILSRRLAKMARGELDLNNSAEALDGEQLSFLVWAQTMAQDAIIAAFGYYCELLFPGRLVHLRKICDLHAGIMMQSIIGPHSDEIITFLIRHASDHPESGPFLDRQAFLIERTVKSNAARRAGSSPRATNPQKVRAIELFNEKQWPSPRKAAQAITPSILKMRNNKLSEDRAEKTVHEWLLEHLKSQK